MVAGDKCARIWVGVGGVGEWTAMRSLKKGPAHDSGRAGGTLLESEERWREITLKATSPQANTGLAYIFTYIFQQLAVTTNRLFVGIMLVPYRFCLSFVVVSRRDVPSTHVSNDRLIE